MLNPRSIGTSLPGAYLNLGGGPVDPFYLFYDPATGAFRPFADDAEACASVGAAFRVCRTVNVAGVEKWWTADLSDGGLHVKTAETILAWGNIIGDPANSPALATYVGGLLPWQYVGPHAARSISRGPLPPTVVIGAGTDSLEFGPFVNNLSVDDDCEALYFKAYTRFVTVARNCHDVWFSAFSERLSVDHDTEFVYFYDHCKYVAVGANCKRIRLYNCQGTDGNPFVVPDNTTDAEYRNNVLVDPSAGGGSYTDAEAKAAAGTMAVASPTVAPTYNAGAATLAFAVVLASLNATHFDPEFVSDGVFSAANKTKLETAANWNGVNWNGVGSQELTGSRKFDTHADATYLYLNIAPDNPIRLLRA